MTQKFIKHPDRSLVIDLSQIATVDKSNDKLGCHPYQLKFNTTGSEVFWWGFKTEEELDQVYDWVCSLFHPAIYGELKHESKPSFESHAHGVDMSSAPDKTVYADITIKNGKLGIKERNKPTIDITKEWRESTTDFNLTPYTGERMDITFNGIQRTLGYYSSLGPSSVMNVVNLISGLTFDSSFDIGFIGFDMDEPGYDMDGIHKLLIDLGCIVYQEGSKPSENIYMKTNVPF